MAPPDQVWDWPVRQHRPLPVPVPPVLDETLNSYIGRLAAVNRLEGSALRAHLAGSTRRYARIDAAILATVSGQSEHALRHALLELNDRAEIAGLAVVGRPIPHQARLGFACSRCALARGHRPAHIQRWTLHEDVLCRRHRRWTGNGDGYLSHLQVDLGPVPDILRAHQQHRALIRRHGRHRVLDAFDTANEFCARWHRRHCNNRDYERLLTQFHGPTWNLSFDDPTIAASRYPQAVGLTRIFVSSVGDGSNPDVTARSLYAVGVSPTPAQFRMLRDYHEGRRIGIAGIGRWEAFPADT